MQETSADLIPLTTDEPPAADRPPAFNRSLRVALAMKGGLSLAVWIGGVVAELDLLRRIRIIGPRETPQGYLVAMGTETEPVIARARSYAELMIGAKYDQIEFDVLAGASAGGLNSVLFGVSQRLGATFEPVLATWLRSGAIWSLLHPPRERRVTSLLAGDDFFYGQVTTAIEHLGQSPTLPDNRARAVSVELSATMIDDDDTAEWGFQEGRAHFRFTGRQAPDREAYVVGAHDETPGRDIPEQYTAGDPAYARMAYAARTTSSFPGAFEAARIGSRPVDGVAALGPSGGAEAADPATIGFDFAFSHHRADTVVGGRRPFRVIDGGTMDNIPIDRALHAVRNMPSEDFVSRAVLYLEPDPKRRIAVRPTPAGPVPPTPDLAPPGVARMIELIRAAMRLQGVRESGDEEIDQIQRFRRDQYLADGRADAFAAQHVGDVGDPARDAYVRYRATADLGLLSDAMLDPARWQLGTELDVRHRFAAASRATLAALETPIRQRYVDDAASRAAIIAGPQGILDAAACAIAWIRALEERQHAAGGWFGDGEPDRREARRMINDVAAVARRHRDRAIFDALQSVQPGGAAAADDAVRTWLERTAAGVDAEHARVLDAAIELIGGLADTSASDPAAPIPWRRGLGALDLAPFTASIGIPSPMSRVQFSVISANDASAVDDAFPQLRAAQAVRRATELMALDEEALRDAFEDAAHLAPADRIGSIDAPTKLAGSTLFSFGAFFSARWRTNDWWWGRLDGAVGIVRILDGLREDEPHADEPPVGLRRRAVQQAVLEQIAQSPAELQPFDVPDGVGDKWGAGRAMTAGAHALSDLRAGYLVAVASRAARAALRAAAWGRSLTQRVLLQLSLPPFLVTLPFAVAPARAVFVGLLVAAGVAITTASPDATLASSGPGRWIGVLVLVLVAVGSLALAGIGVRDLRRTDDRRRRIMTSLTAGTPDDDPVRVRLQLLHRRTRARSWWSLAIAVVLLLGAIGLAVVDDGPQSRSWVLAVAGIGALAFARATAAGFSGGRPRPASTGWLLAALVPLAGIAASREIGMIVDQTWIVVIVVVIAGAAAVALSAGWLPASRDVPAAAAPGAEPGAESAAELAHPGKRWLWSAVTILATMAAAALAAIVVAVNFGEGSLLAASAAAALLAWFAGAHAFWWCSERAASASVAGVDDRPVDGAGDLDS